MKRPIIVLGYGLGDGPLCFGAVGFLPGYALDAAGGAASFDQANTEFLDLQDVLSAVLLADNFLLGRISVGQAPTETTHYWPEDVLNSPTIAQAGGEAALDDSGTSLVVASGTGSLVRPGALLRDVASGKSEVIQVTAVSTDTLTIVRGYGSTSGQEHAAGATFRIISQPKQENDVNVNDRSKQRTKNYNYTQIFKYEVETSGTILAIKQAGVPNELAYQIQQRTLELQRELGANVSMGIRSASAGSDSVYRSAGGTREYLTASGGNIDDAGGAWTGPRISDLYKRAWDDGGDPMLHVSGATQARRIAADQADKIRIDPSSRVRGYHAEFYLTDMGREVELLVDRWFPDDEVQLLDMSRVNRSILRPWHMEPLAKVGDGERAMVLAEETLVVKNGTTSHAIATGLSIPS
jgi:hypothetical protein